LFAFRGWVAGQWATQMARQAGRLFEREFWAAYKKAFRAGYRVGMRRALIEGQKMLIVGDVLLGYCGGEFGRDSYGNKRVEALGADWVVVRNSLGDVEFASGEDVHDRLAQFCKRLGAQPTIEAP
jgi:hypothetical protein